MIFNKTIARRTFLKGAGVTIGLPFLEAMTPALARSAGPGKHSPTRVSYIYVPNGRIMGKWTPATEGAGYAMTPSLEPLAAFRDDMLVLSGLNIKAADPVGAEPGGNHARSCGAYLTGVHPKKGGISVDQVIANQVGKQTQLSSLEITLDPPVPFAADGVYSAYYMNTISWRSSSTPLPMEVNPRAVFERMFGDSDSSDPALRARQMQEDKSILDTIMERVASLNADLGPADRGKLAEYLDSIRDVERRIKVSQADQMKESPSAARPAGMPAKYSEHFQIMTDLQVLAFRTDLTRVITFMMGRDQTDRSFLELGVGDGHHALSHHKDDQESIARVEKIDYFQSQLFASYLQKLKSIADGDGTLLDHSILVFGSSLGDGNRHWHHDVPQLVVGGGSGQLKGGRHIRYEGIPFSNLHLAVIDMMGVPIDEFLRNKDCDATGKLDRLTV